MVYCYNRTSVVQEIVGVPEEGYAPFNFPVDGGYLPFYFTNETFTKVLSALVNGAFLTYGDQAHQVIWYFLQNVEYPVSLCEQIAACIATSEATQDALRNFITTDTAINQHIQEIAGAGVPLPETELPIPIVSGCDPDQAWAAVDAMVEQMNTNNLDFFQLFEEASNLIERTTQLLTLAPSIKGVSPSVISGFVEELFDNIYENYESTITTSLLNQYKCDLFCLMMDDPECFLKFNTMYDYWRNRMEATFDIESALQQVLQFLATGTWSSTLIADFMFMFQIQIIRSANNFLGIDVLSLQTVASVGALVPSSAWELLCPSCVPTDWCFTIDLKASNGSASGVQIGAPEFPNSLWVSGEGVRSTDPLDRVWFGQNMPATIDLDEATIEWEFVPGEEFSASNVWLGFNGSEGSPTPIAEDQTSFTRSGLTGVEDLIFILERSGFNETRLANITRITLRGQGDNPFGSDNC